jgi:hypothetical protein
MNVAAPGRSQEKRTVVLEAVSSSVVRSSVTS